MLYTKAQSQSPSIRVSRSPCQKTTRCLCLCTRRHHFTTCPSLLQILPLIYSSNLPILRCPSTDVASSTGNLEEQEKARRQDCGGAGCAAIRTHHGSCSKSKSHLKSKREAPAAGPQYERAHFPVQSTVRMPKKRRRRRFRSRRIKETCRTKTRNRRRRYPCRACAAGSRCRRPHLSRGCCTSR